MAARKSMAGLDDCVLEVGRLAVRDAGPRQARHRHKSAFELYYVHKGAQTVVLGAQPILVPRGSALMTKPGEPHGGVRKIIQPGVVYWMLFDLGRCRMRFGLDFAPVADALESFERRSFAVGPVVAELFEQALAVRADAASPFGEAFLAATVKILLISVARGYLRSMEAGRSHGGAGDRGIQRAVEWADSHVTEDWSVADAAAVAGMKSSRFHELFTRATGFPPIERRNRRRVQMAKEMLSSGGNSITEIAFDLGFCSSQYFATVFRKYEGVTPLRYRQDSQGVSLESPSS